ncbi:MAG: LysR family glycine cleavage system transcriptional activator [Oleispira sp.]|jgi:DNA-binding transcriptional LysR family regulator
MKKTHSLNSLKTFEVCARVESVQEAAKLLHVTPSAVSHQLKRLELELAVTLFHRSHRKITVTSKGRMLQSTLSKAFELIEGTLEDIQENDIRELVINILPVFSIRWLNTRLLGFFSQFPEIDLTLKNSYRVDDFLARKCDIAIRWGTGHWPNVYSEKLFDEYAMPVLSPELFNLHKIKHEKDLLTLPLIQIYEEADHWQQWAKLNGYRLAKNTKYIKYNDPSAALQAAADGLGVVLGPLALIHNELNTGKLVRPFVNAINTNQSYYLVISDKSDLDKPNILAFVNWIRAEAEIFRKIIHAEVNNGTRGS